MFDEDFVVPVTGMLLCFGILFLVCYGSFQGGKTGAYQEACQKSCPGGTAQVIESPTERVCMCGTKLEGTLVLEVRKP